MILTIGIGTLVMVGLLVSKFYSPSMAIHVYKDRIEPQLREKIKREDITDLLTEKDWKDLDGIIHLKLEDIYDLRQRISGYVKMKRS
jgi:hypothetical protein